MLGFDFEHLTSQALCAAVLRPGQGLHRSHHRDIYIYGSHSTQLLHVIIKPQEVIFTIIPMIIICFHVSGRSGSTVGDFGAHVTT